jgi:hypothetical protein
LRPRRADWTEIDVRVVPIASIATGEYQENELRKDFTVSERAAIMLSIEREKLGDNQHTGGSGDLPN